MAPDSLLRLPNELLHHIARSLPRRDRYSWMLTCRLFRDLVIDLLYLDDIHESNGSGVSAALTVTPRSLLWGCSAGSVSTFERAQRAGAHLSNYPALLRKAINGANPTATVRYLLDHGADPHAESVDLFGADPYRPDAWHLVEAVLDSCHRQSRKWCPVPVLRALLEHGANVSTVDGFGTAVMNLWFRIMTLEHVADSPRRNSTSTTTSTIETANTSIVSSPCTHAGSCRVSSTKLLLLHGADPDFHDTVHTLVTLAMTKLKRPAEIIACLADAGANLDRRFISGVHEYCEHPRFPGYYEVPIHWSQTRHDVVEAPAPIHLAAANAVLLSSLARRPRREGWDTWHSVTCPKAGEMVKFLLSKGVEVDRRARILLDRWDAKWMQWYVPRAYVHPRIAGRSGERRRQSVSPRRYEFARDFARW